MNNIYEFDAETGFGILWDNAGDANVLLRSLANENRLMILCLLADGEKSVGEIEQLTGARQPTVSQQLARLRADGIVESRRDGKTIHYNLCCDRTRKLLEEMCKFYRAAAASSSAAGGN
jgi:DNA-binding transcriptional ArsR family regulator